MRKTVVFSLLAVIIVLISFLYRFNHSPIYKGFPIDVNNKLSETGEDVFYLYYFFSYKDCQPCLETLSVLNRISSPFRIVGVTPDDEVTEANFIKKEFGIEFNIIPIKNLKKFRPPYSPSLVGVDKHGRIHFVIPSVPHQREYLENFLYNFFERAFPLISRISGNTIINATLNLA